MSTFCVTGDRKNVDTAVSMLKRLIAEGNSEMLLAGNANANVAGGGVNGNVANGSITNGSIANGSFASGGNIANGNIVNGNIVNGNNMDRRGPGGVGVRGSGGEMSHGLGRLGGDGSPPTAPCRSALF